MESVSGKFQAQANEFWAIGASEKNSGRLLGIS